MSALMGGLVLSPINHAGSVSGAAAFYGSKAADGSISVGIYPATADNGKTQSIFLFASVGGALWVRHRSGWTQWTSADIFSAPSIDGDLTNPNVPRVLGSSFTEPVCTACESSLQGLHLWLGYGSNIREMIEKDNYREVLVLATSPFVADVGDLVDPGSHYSATLNLLEIKLKAIAGEKLTIADVNADIDPFDANEPEINVHFQSADYPDDKTASNAKLRMRGKSSRLAAQKSYRVKLNSGVALWRKEQTLQLNKHPYDLTRVRNKLAFDLFAEIPHITSLRTQFVHMLFDDDGATATADVDYGLYTHVEKMGKEFLSNRGWSTSSNIYKAEDFTFARDARLVLNADGTPVNTTDFEKVLSIENGKDHKILLQMIEDINSEGTDFNVTFAKYFNRNNYLTWLASNILMGNWDTISQNFALLQPAGTTQFHLMPWDYDGSLGFESQPVAVPSLLYADWQLGLSNWSTSPLHRRFLQQPGNLAALENAVEELRARYLTADKIKSKLDGYKPVVEAVLMREPDLSNLDTVGSDTAVRRQEWAAEYARLISVIDDNYRLFRQRLEKPMPFWQSAEVVEGQLILSWEPAVDLQNDAVTYALQVADLPDFSSSSIRLRQEGLSETSWATDPLPNGTYYLQVTATDSKGNRQNGFDRTDSDGKSYLGVYKFTVVN